MHHRQRDPCIALQHRCQALVIADLDAIIELFAEHRRELVVDAFDIDALDPAFAPGTGTPEIGGLATWQAQAILRNLGGVAFVGMDVMEVAPAYDHGEITALAAATIVWEYLGLVGAKE
jgi:agmatinase